MRMRMDGANLLGTLAVLMLTASCRGPESEPVMEDMGDMPGMAGPDTSADATRGSMMDRMRGHMERMAAMPADSLDDVLPIHRQMVGNMLAEMNREMAQMNMAADSTWTAAIDSLRADLTRMPDMGTEQLRELMPAHRERVQRLMSMHDAMMRAM